MSESTFRAALRTELTTNLINWGISLSLSQMNSLIAHIEQLIITNSGGVVSNATADLVTWPEPPKGRHS